jgi:hypothetical protein
MGKFLFEFAPAAFFVVLGNGGLNDPQGLPIVSDLHRIAGTSQALDLARLAKECAERDRFHHV